jgi:hypothetical protein
MLRRALPEENRGMATSAINEIITITMRSSMSVNPLRGARRVRRAVERNIEARVDMANTGPNVKTAA